MMQIILDGKIKTDRSVVALGMFDGVHIGHRVLLERGAALARQHGVPLVVSTFREHPLQVIAPDKCPPQLTTFEERAKLMEALGVDVLYAMPFDAETMNMPPEDYVGHLVRQFHPTDVVCGYNHTFGRKGEGKANLLAFLGAALGFATSIVPKITLGGKEVSSTAIRSLIAQGDVAQARELLGHPYVLDASVTENGLKICENGKQTVPHGTYRTICVCGGKRLPATIRIGDALVCRLPETMQQAHFELLAKV